MNTDRSKRKPLNDRLKVILVRKGKLSSGCGSLLIHGAIEIPCSQEEVTKGKLAQKIFPCIPKLTT